MYIRTYDKYEYCKCGTYEYCKCKYCLCVCTYVSANKMDDIHSYKSVNIMKQYMHFCKCEYRPCCSHLRKCEYQQSWRPN